MIGFMPDFYPDELVYSLLARYYQRSGYLAYRYAAEELFEDPSARQDMYFLPRLTSGARTFGGSKIGYCMVKELLVRNMQLI